MGEIADDMVDGTCCSICGQYFKDPDKENSSYTHGYPVACWDCWDNDCGYARAVVETF